MRARRLLPYLAGLLILAFALGSLPKGSPGGSLLFQSTWLLYVIYLGPVAILGLMVVMIAIIALNWRDIGSAMGFKMAQQRRGKRRSKTVTFIQMFVIAIAVAVLIEKPGTIFNPRLGGTNSTIVKDITNGAGGGPNPFQGFFFAGITNFVQSDWFGIAFFGILVVGALVLFEAVRTALKETSEMSIENLQSRQIEGLQAAKEAIRLFDESRSDSRTRIIQCFHHMVTTASRLGVPVSSDQTGRELEKAIRATFALKGEAATELTRLFEEARYSLHMISEDDAANARHYLEAIADELRINLHPTSNVPISVPIQALESGSQLEAQN